jgi:hypothetical protein
MNESDPCAPFVGLSSLTPEALERARVLQKDMVRLLQQSSVDPISYVGLDHCSADHCGRVGCSEACWFGMLRRRSSTARAISRLMTRHEGPHHRIRVWKPAWDRPYGELSNADIVRTKTFVRTICNSLCDMSLVVVGAFEAVPFSPGVPNWFCELHALISGSDEKRLEDAFSVMAGNGSARITKIEDLRKAIDEIIGSHLPMYFSPKGSLEPKQKNELYDWLLKLELGARIFRYGCDINFELITYRKIRWKPKPVPKRKRRRRRARRYRVEPTVLSHTYYDD